MKLQKPSVMKSRQFLIWLILVLCLPEFLIATSSSGKNEQNVPQQAERQLPAIIIAPAPYKPEAQSSDSLKGKAQFVGHHCSSCHSTGASGGCLAPPLNGIGARRDKAFILARITNESALVKEFEKLYPHAELMPHPRISAQNAKLIAAYLMTLPEPEGGYRISPHTPSVKSAVTSQPLTPPIDAAPDAVAKGKSLFYGHGCISCHAIGNIGGHFAPRLDGISGRRDRAYISERINATEFLSPKYSDEYQERGTSMPPTTLNEEEIQQVVTFLMSLPQEP